MVHKNCARDGCPHSSRDSSFKHNGKSNGRPLPAHIDGSRYAADARVCNACFIEPVKLKAFNDANAAGGIPRSENTGCSKLPRGKWGEEVCIGL